MNNIWLIIQYISRLKDFEETAKEHHQFHKKLKKAQNYYYFIDLLKSESLSDLSSVLVS